MGASDVERWRRIDWRAVTPFENAAMMPVRTRDVGEFSVDRAIDTARKVAT
jgi:hypothetical protein